MKSLGGLTVTLACWIAFTGCAPVHKSQVEIVRTSLNEIETAIGDIEALARRGSDTTRERTEALDAVSAIVTNLDEINAQLSNESVASELRNRVEDTRDLLGRGGVNNARQRLDAQLIEQRCAELRVEVATMKARLAPGISSFDYKQVLDPLMSFAALMLAGPGIVLTMFLLFAISPKARGVVRSMLTGVRSVKVAGIMDVELTAENAGLVSHRVGAVFDSYRKQITSEARRLVDVYNLDAKLVEIMEQIRSKVRDGDVRATVHVEDVIFENYFMQLIDYQPPTPEKKAGRSWPIRLGLVGLVWRTGRREYIPEITYNDRDKLVTTWGMTKKEVGAWAIKRQSLLAIPLRSRTEEVIGVFYMDHDEPHAFDDNIMEEIEKACAEVELVEAVSKVSKELGKICPKIRI